MQNSKQKDFNSITNDIAISFVNQFIDVHEEFYAPLHVSLKNSRIIKSKRECLEELKLSCRHCGATLYEDEINYNNIQSDDITQILEWVKQHILKENINFK